MGFEKTNRQINERIQVIASKFCDDTITERERNELSTLIYPKLRYHIWKFCQNNDDTEEALQWTLKKIFNNISKYDKNNSRFTTWIYTIARNETLFYLHMKGKNKTYDGETDFNMFADEPEDIFNTFEEDFKKLYDETIFEIQNIDDPLLKNIAVDQMINKDQIVTISDRYDINPNTVKTKLRKIRKDIKSKVLTRHPRFKDTLSHIFEFEEEDEKTSNKDEKVKV